MLVCPIQRCAIIAIFGGYLIIEIRMLLLLGVHLFRTLSKEQTVRFLNFCRYSRLVEFLACISPQQLVHIETPSRIAAHERFFDQREQDWQRSPRDVGSSILSESAVKDRQVH